MRILCDIGGTFIRMAVAGDKEPENIRKYEVAGFETLADGLTRYCADEGLEPGGTLRIAYAGQHDEETCEHPWIDEAGLEKVGWSIEVFLNDFEGAALALPHLAENEQRVFKGTPNLSDTLCLIGPGTGLGLAYLRDGKVQKTQGGQMAAAGVTAEQCEIIAYIQGDLPMLPYEELVSGRGLEAIYKASNGDGIALENFLENLDDPAVQKALRLFHEFFALFAANAVIAGHANGGLYLTGGVMERLVQADAFDFAHFEAVFCAHSNAKVEAFLNSIAITHVAYSYPALKGLYHA